MNEELETARTSLKLLYDDIITDFFTMIYLCFEDVCHVFPRKEDEGNNSTVRRYRGYKFLAHSEKLSGSSRSWDWWHTSKPNGRVFFRDSCFLCLKPVSTHQGVNVLYVACWNEGMWTSAPKCCKVLDCVILATQSSLWESNHTERRNWPDLAGTRTCSAQLQISYLVMKYCC